MPSSGRRHGDVTDRDLSFDPGTAVLLGFTDLAGACTEDAYRDVRRVSTLSGVPGSALACRWCQAGVGGPSWTRAA
jgi:hypothetical protein